MSDHLVNWLASVALDPYSFVMGAFPWGEEGTRLEKEKGPEGWQIEVLCHIRDKLKEGLISSLDEALATIDEAILVSRASGHGVGKSALVSWLILWAISTFPDTRGVVTANTENQLKTKTWAELGKWYHMFIAKEQFHFTATAIYSIDPAHERTWRIDMVPWSEKNTEAFAGLHNKNRRILVIFDEASAIPDIIWETTEGALTDAETQIIWAVFGNPTRNSGRFKECFRGGKFAKYWNSKQVDSRQVSFTNKAQIAKWIEAYGEDDDFVRIRVYGQFPKVGELEFFNADDVQAAMERDAISQITDPLALGVDVARFGANCSVIFFRKGRDARSIPRQVYRGMSTVDLAAKVFAAHEQYHSNGIFVDGGGVGGGVVDNIRNMHLFCFDVAFGGKATLDQSATGSQGEKYANKRAEMYGALRAWIKSGGAIPNDQDLKRQLCAITYTFNNKDAIQLVSKEDMMKDLDGLSPDDADALALTFAFPLAPMELGAGGEYGRHGGPALQSEYNPYADEYMKQGVAA